MKYANTLWIAVTLAGIMISPVFAADAEGTDATGNPTPGPASMGAKKHGRGGLVAKLGLSEDKAKEIKNRMHETRKTMIKLKADRDIAKADLEHLFTADTLDKKAIIATADKLAEINAEMTKTQVKARLATSSMLTPEQRTKMNNLRQGMMQRFKKRREGRHNQRHAQRMERNDRPEDEPGDMPAPPEDKAF